MSNRIWTLVTLPESFGFGSFNTLKICQIKPDEFAYTEGKRVGLIHITLPTANGYQTLDGREHAVFYRKEIIALIRTEDCGLGSAKAEAYIKSLGFKRA